MFCCRTMALGAQSFDAFAEQVASWFQTYRYNRRDLARVASYFWNRLNDHHKQQYKISAYHENREEGRAGRRKLRGFWLFAKNLETHMKNYESYIFYEIWHNMLLEHQRTWYEPGQRVIEQEISRIGSNLSNLSL